ncbi:uncharacterized protein LOC131675336 [Phymastichus coffea]|uniref:uncharacterized protein LOC131675336 n=1 Tax=Phymastichus coffea TaxID=108790 RepID=UPI00273A7BD4|nr:uncharacterized protein LOC131675336 [Phymastichus coffea]
MSVTSDCCSKCPYVLVAISEAAAIAAATEAASAIFVVIVLALAAACALVLGGVRKKNRSQEEEEVFQLNRRRERAERQKFRRQQARQLFHESNRTTHSSTQTNVQNNTIPDYLGKLEIPCKHCHALHFKDEKVKGKGLSFNDCCGHGSVSLDPLLEFPEELQLLLKGEHHKSVLFFEHIRAYNNSLSFASFNANLVNFQSRRPGPYCFKVQGQVYYQINTSLYPCDDENPSYDLNFTLDTIIRENNAFAQSYHMIRQEIEYQQALFNETNQPQPELQLLFSLKPGQDKGRYNFQRVNEVAAIFATTADGEIPELYVTIRNKNTKSLQCVSTMDPNVELWIYPLFYPYGSSGWFRNLQQKDNSNRRVTRMAYHKYRMAIRYCKDHQKELRADTYKGVSDYMQNSADTVNGQVGKSVILPSTFIGSPRYMQQCYQDAMALVNEKGKPDIFLTMTCNPNWVEIQEILLPGQQACDRPDLVAQISNKSENPHLQDLVINHMTHGPCGDWCMKDGKCSKNFPKQFQNETTLDENGYPHYRRRNDGITVNKTNNHEVDNRWVVPYCAILLELFDCHINVEAVSSICAVKYLYKYIYKGHDAATVVIQDSENGTVVIHNEICQFLDARYVGPVEACWRMLSKTLQDKSHSIMRLPVHLPNEQNIYFSESVYELNLEILQKTSSLLLDFFQLNRDDESARQYYYSEIPSHFTHKKTKINDVTVTKWQPRKKHFNTIGAESFEHLRTVDNAIHPTFSAACLALGLIENDDEWNRAMNEGVQWVMPQRLRCLFVRILIHCQPTKPEELWMTFQDALSEDFSRTQEKDLAYQMAYADINRILNDEGRSLEDIPSMPPLLRNSVHVREHFLLIEMADRGNVKYNNLNPLQKEIVDLVSNAVHDENYSGPRCIFMEGPGGSGKTYVYETMYDLLTSKNIEVCTMAYTGIAATLLPNGKTVHKIFGLPVPMFNDSTSNIKAQSKEAKKLRKTAVFIWDEAPMAPRYALDIANKVLQDVMGNNLPFRGKIMILGGDFKQLLPIKVRGTRNETLNLSIKYSPLWKHFIKYILTTNMRVLSNEIDFSNFLLNVGNGSLNDKDDYIDVPDHCILPETVSIIDIFGQLIRDKKFDEMSDCAILSTRNEDVDNINREITDLLGDVDQHIYTAIDTVVNNNR